MAAAAMARKLLEELLLPLENLMGVVLRKLSEFHHHFQNTYLHFDWIEID